jgi:hypothetical protein
VRGWQQNTTIRLQNKNHFPRKIHKVFIAALNIEEWAASSIAINQGYRPLYGEQSGSERNFLYLCSCARQNTLTVRRTNAADGQTLTVLTDKTNQHPTRRTFQA